MHTTTPSCRPGLYAGTPENRSKRVYKLPEPEDGELKTALDHCRFLTDSQGSSEWFILRRFRITGTTAGQVIREYARRIAELEGAKYVKADDGTRLLEGNEFDQILMPILKVLNKDNEVAVTRDFEEEKHMRETKYTEPELNRKAMATQKTKTLSTNTFNFGSC